MPYNIWIFPLLSGYYFINNFVYYKYRFQRVDSQRLIFHSIIAGIFSFILIYGLRLFLELFFSNKIQLVHDWIYGNFIIERQPLLMTSTLGFLIVIALVKITNKILEKCDYFKLKKPVEHAVDKYGDEIEQLFKYSFLDKSLVQITLKNEKVYVGYASEILPPKQTNFLKLIPVISGYREPITKQITFNTEYLEVLNLIESDPEKYQSINLDIIIKQDEILIANIFDIDIYQKFSNS